MAAKKRSGEESARPANDRNPKKQKHQTKAPEPADNNDNDGEDTLDFQAVDLLDSDEDIDNAVADDGASTDASDDSLDSLERVTKPSSSRSRPQKKPLRRNRASEGEEESDDDEDKDEYDDDDDDDDDDEDASIGGTSDSEEGSPAYRAGGSGSTTKSKRNDPTMFSTSLKKILGTKLSTTRRSDPVLARSAAAREASRRIVDAALEEKARKQLRAEKRVALEKGRIKDVLVASNAPGASLGSTGAPGSAASGIPEETTASILETERRLRKVAQRGVVKLFNAVRAAQIKAAEAERMVKKEGLLGIDKREAKVTEMSRKGFLDLIASGGGGLKKSGLEEA